MIYWWLMSYFLSFSLHRNIQKCIVITHIFRISSRFPLEMFKSALWLVFVLSQFLCRVTDDDLFLLLLWRTLFLPHTYCKRAIVMAWTFHLLLVFSFIDFLKCFSCIFFTLLTPTLLWFQKTISKYSLDGDRHFAARTIEVWKSWNRHSLL